MSRKPSEIEKYERMREVYQFMINGSKKTRDIVHFIGEKWKTEGVNNWDENTTDDAVYRTVSNYIKRVKDTYFNFDEDIENEKGRTLARLDDLYSKSIKIQDYKGALSVLKEIADVVGFKAPIKIDNNINGEVNIKPKKWISTSSK
jgi:hypothetical protein